MKVRVLLAVAAGLMLGIIHLAVGLPSSTGSPLARVEVEVAGAAARLDLPEFRMIGVSAPAGSPLAGQARIHTAAGWSAWHELETTDNGPDPGSPEATSARPAGLVSQPIWAGHADGYQLDLTALTGVRVHLVRDVVTDSGLRPAIPAADAAPAETAAATASPAIAARSAWGAREPRVAPTYASTVRMAFIHHTVDANDYTADEVPTMLRAIQAYHMDVNGWDDIAYPFIVDRFGTIWEGRGGGVDRAVVGAHTEGFNTGSTGIAVLGEFTSTAPSSAALDATARLLGWKLPLTAVDPSSRATMTSGGNDRYPSGTTVTFDAVAGHRDARTTACPGNAFYELLPQLRRDASSYAGVTTAYPGFLGGTFVATGQLDSDAPPEIVTGADAGGGPHLRTFDANGSARASEFVFPVGFGGGVRVATGDVDVTDAGDPALLRDEIIAAAGPGGGPHVRVIRENGAEVGSFFAYDPGFHGGIYVAAGNVDGIPGDEIITAPGAGGGPHVRILRRDGSEVGGFMAYGVGWTGGVRVAAGDVDGDGVDEIVTAPGAGGGPHLRVFELDGSAVGGFMAYSPAFHGGAYVATTPASDARADLIVTGAGEGGGPHVRVFRADGAEVAGFFAGFPSSGVRVAGGLFRGARPGDLALVGGPRAMSLIRLTRISGQLILL